jgi:hypothetical protein
MLTPSVQINVLFFTLRDSYAYIASKKNENK